jgi:hypothetical protein
MRLARLDGSAKTMILTRAANAKMFVSYKISKESHGTFSQRRVGTS